MDKLHKVCLPLYGIFVSALHMRRVPPTGTFEFGGPTCGAYAAPRCKVVIVSVKPCQWLAAAPGGLKPSRWLRPDRDGRGFSALVLASETIKVLTHSTIPVVVYR